MYCKIELEETAVFSFFDLLLCVCACVCAYLFYYDGRIFNVAIKLVQSQFFKNVICRLTLIFEMAACVLQPGCIDTLYIIIILPSENILYIYSMSHLHGKKKTLSG